MFHVHAENFWQILSWKLIVKNNDPKLLNSNLFMCTITVRVLPSMPKACRPNKPSVQNRIPFELYPMCFVVGTGSTQTMPSCHGLNYAWGEHWINNSLP